MPRFYFTLFDHEGLCEGEEVYAFPDVAAALSEAELVLAEMALDGLPRHPHGRLEVEVLDADKRCIAKVSLELRRELFI